MATVFKNCGKFSLFCCLLSCPLSALASIAFAMSLQPIIDDGLSGDMERFIATTCTAVLIACGDVLLDYNWNMQKKKVVISCTQNLRFHYVSLFFQQDIARFLEKDSAVYLSKLTVDADVIGEKYCESVLNLYSSLWSLAISVICIASTRLELAAYVLIISFVSVNLPRVFQRKAAASERAYLDSGSAHINMAQECIRNYLVIRLFKLVPSQMSKYQQAVSDMGKKDSARKKRAFAVDAAASAVSCVSFIAIIALCMLFVMQGKLSVGYTMSVSQLLGGVMVPFERLPGYLVAYRAGKQIYLANEAELRAGMRMEGGRKLLLNHTDDHMDIENMSFSYRADSPAVLRDISLSLDLKKKYAVVGKSGSGKSTLAKIMMGLLAPTRGGVSLNGVPLQELDRSSLYGAVAYQNQTASFFDGTIKENIVLGKHLSEDTWRHIIEASRLDDMLGRLPEREFAVIQENGKNISGGEAQRICLARCLARQPSFILFDEIAASLDGQNAAAIEKTILSLEHVGALHITHRIYEENMRQYDAILVLKDGRISEQGTWEELVAKKGDFYQLAFRGHGPDDGTTR